MNPQLAFFLGFISGMLGAIAIGIFSIFQRSFIENITKDLRQQDIPFLPQESAEFFEPTPPDVEALEEVIQKNEERGEATNLDELAEDD